eukprot:2586175-Rhodomonas_salina.1
MVRECIKTHVEDKRPRLNSLGEEPPDAASSASDDDKVPVPLPPEVSGARRAEARKGGRRQREAS